MKLGYIMGTYQRLVDTVKGRSGADPTAISIPVLSDPPLGQDKKQEARP